MLLIAIIVGAIVGATASGEGGALAGALFGWLVVRSLRQQREIEALRKQAATRRWPSRARGHRRSTSRPRHATPIVAPDRAGAGGRRARPGSRCRCRPGPMRLRQRALPLRRPRPVPSRRPPAIAGGGVPHAPTRRDPLAPIKRWLFGGNTIVKAGIGILFVGLAFLAKYASRARPSAGRVRLAAIGAAAVVLLGFGWRLRLSRPDYAQVLQGGAVAVLYLTLFAAFRYYGVLAALPAFVLMVAVAALAAALAVLQDARSLAVVGALGGFATPLIVSTGSDNYVALFAYYFVLDARHRRRRLVEDLAAAQPDRLRRHLRRRDGLGRAQVPAGGVRDQPGVPDRLLPALRRHPGPAGAAHRARARRRGDGSPRSDAWVNSSLLFGLPTITFALEYGLVRGTPFGAALAALALAGFYVLLATWMKRRPELGITFDATLAIATVFLTLVIPFALDERSTAGAWTLEGAGLVWIGFRQRRGLPRAFGYLLLLSPACAMLLGHERHGAPTLVFNAYLFNGLMAAAASLAAAFFVHRARGDAGAAQAARRRASRC